MNYLKPAALLNVIDLLAKVFRWSPVRASILLLGRFAVSLLEGVSLLALYPVLLAVFSSDSGNVESMPAIFTQLQVLIGDDFNLETALTVLCVIIITKFVVLFCVNIFFGDFFIKMAKHYRMDLFETILESRVSNLLQRSTGEYANISGEIITNYINALKASFAVLTQTMQVVVNLSAALFVSWQLTSSAVAVVLVIAAVLAPTGRIVRRASHERTKAMSKFSSILVDALQGIKPLKAMAKEHLILGLFKQEIESYGKAQMRETIASTIRLNLPEVLLFIAVAYGLYWSLTYLGQGIEEVGVVLIILLRMSTEFTSLLGRLQQVLSYEGGVRLVDAVIGENRNEKEVLNGGIMPEFERSISFVDAAVGYHDTDLFSNLTLEIEPRNFYLLRGPSGIGKTSIVDTVVGLLPLRHGSLFIDDVPVAELDIQAWREMIGYVPQDTFLFNGTVRENLSLFDQSVTDKEIQQALIAADADGFVYEMGDGLSADVGERGMRFSGGQRQRLAIARALIQNPKILIMDEATSALDPKTELAIGKTLKKLSEKLTIIAITHHSTLVPFASHLIDVNFDENGVRFVKASIIQKERMI
jgi:ATP-binding cassette subfamily C protein